MATTLALRPVVQEVRLLQAMVAAVRARSAGIGLSASMALAAWQSRRNLRRTIAKWNRVTAHPATDWHADADVFADAKWMLESSRMLMQQIDEMRSDRTVSWLDKRLLDLVWGYEEELEDFAETILLGEHPEVNAFLSGVADCANSNTGQDTPAEDWRAALAKM